MTKAIKIFQTACNWKATAADGASFLADHLASAGPDGAPFLTKGRATAAGAGIARERIAGRLLNAADLRAACDDQGLRYPRGLAGMGADDATSDLIAALADKAAIEIAGCDQIGFEMQIYSAWVEA